MPSSRPSTPPPDTRKRPAASTPTVTVGHGYERRPERRVSKAVRPSRMAAGGGSSGMGGRAPPPTRARGLTLMEPFLSLILERVKTLVCLQKIALGGFAAIPTPLDVLGGS